MGNKPGSNHDEHFYLGVISNIAGHPGSGLWQVYFEDGSFCHIESGYGLRVMSQAYGGLENALGKVIKYKTDEINVMTSFGPVESLQDDLFHE